MHRWPRWRVVCSARSVTPLLLHFCRACLSVCLSACHDTVTLTLYADRPAGQDGGLSSIEQTRVF